MNARLEKVFHRVADLPATERAQYFAAHGIDEDTRREVESLLAFDRGASKFLVHDISVAASRALPQLEAKGGRCGPYQLLDVIGRGGMGAVYLAERVDGEVSQRVAVKLLPLGAGDSLRERFLQERQILATLTHPNVARLLDAGHLDHGQPFLVMEYVEGRPIDAFAAGLGVRQRIALFLKVCAAVAHLHRHLIVHRDLKPSNILVTADGEPKLLDFGIAKLLDVATETTVTGMRLLTPDYASPEQMAGGRLTTTTDVYSLGAVLYLLLTGEPAHEFVGRSPEAIASIVISRDVTRPSQWAPELKGDLEAILLKALRKDPQERYETVEHFAEDLRAFVESRPVRARSGNASYRARKFLRRYWVSLTTAAVMIASLGVGLYIANRERAIAERRFGDVRQLANKLFEIDVNVRRLPGSAQTRQLIVDTSLEYLRRLAGDVRGDPGLALELGTAYMRVARVQGVNISVNLGQSEQAEQNLRTAEGLIESVIAAEPDNRTAFVRMAQIAHDRMMLASERRADDEALALARRSAGWLEKYLSSRPLETAEAEQVVIALNNVGNFLRLRQQLDEALRMTRRGIEIARPIDSRPIQLQVGGLLIGSARIQRDRGALQEALRDIREAAAILEPSPGTVAQQQWLTFALALEDEGLILASDRDPSLTRPGEAAASFRRAFQIADDIVHKDANDAQSRGSLSAKGRFLANLLRQSDARAAIDVYDHVLRHLAEVKNNPRFRRLEVFSLSESTYALHRLGRSPEARQRLDAAFARLRELKLYPTDRITLGSETELTVQASADLEAGLGNLARALEIARKLVEDVLASKPNPEQNLTDASRLSRLYKAVADLSRRAGHPDRAFELEARRLQLWQHWDRKLPNNAFVLRQIAATPTP
jgi:tetratricopeptide (TPR) repeat protein/predicted Ser/Thr protein kinase